MRAFEGHIILIVESEIGPFDLELQRALVDAGAETLVARDVPTALLRHRQFEFTAAVVNVEHAALNEGVDIRTLIYGTDEVGRSPATIVAHLSRLLAEN